MNAFHMQAIALLVLLAAAIGAGQERVAYEGSFNVYAAGKLVQTDRFSFTADEKAVDEVADAATKEEIRYEALWTADAGVTSYRSTANGLARTSALREGNMFTFREGEGMSGAVPVEGPVVVVEPAAYAETGFLLGAYDAAKGGKQKFDIVVPSAGDLVTVEIERHGSDMLHTGKEKTDVAHYRIAFGKKEVVNCWTDGGRIVAMYFATKGLTVADARFPELPGEIKSLVNKPQ